MEKMVLTKAGKEKLESEYQNLVNVVRPEVASAIALARSQGDLSENADYKASKEKQGEVETRIYEIEQILRNATIVKYASKTSKSVGFGSTVNVKNLKNGKAFTYQIVGSIEADPFATPTQISNISPVGEALFGKKVGDIVTVKASSPFNLEILKIVQPE